MSDWSRYDVPALWGELRSRSVDAGWAQWAAWQKMSDLLADQANRMMGYQADMENAWPPSGTAASYFHERLAAITEALRANSISAGRIGAALAQVNGASFAAYEAMRQLNEQWQAAGQDQPLTGKGGVGSSARRKELNEQAYAVMNEYEATLVEASKNFIPPEGMGMWRDPEGEGTNFLSRNERGGDSAIDSSESSGTTTLDGSDLSYAGSDGPYSGSAVDLAGVPAEPSVVSGFPAGGKPSAGPGADFGPVGPVVSPLGPGNAVPGRRLGVAGPGRGITAPAGSVRRALPPGGVIGGQPVADSSRPGVPAGRGPLAPGGVMGGRQPGATRVGAPSAGAVGRQGFAVPPGGRRPDPRDEHHSSTIGVQWSAAEGGPAVIEARPEPEHSPGPGVIGIDR